MKVSRLCFLLFTCWITLAATASAATEKELLVQLQQTKGPKRLDILQSLMGVTYGDEKLIDYVRQLYREADSFDSLRVKAQAATEMSLYYYNYSMTDSSIVWGKRAMLLAEQSHSMDYYYLAGSNYASALANVNRIDEAIILGRSMYEKALDAHDTDNIPSACSVLGTIYSSAHQYSESERFYEEQLHYYRANAPENKTLYLQLYIDLIPSVLNRNNYAKALTYCTEFDKLIDSQRKDKGQAMQHILNLCNMFCRSYRISAYTSLKRWKDVERLLPDYRKYIAAYDDLRQSEFLSPIMLYYYHSNSLDKALEVLKQIAKLNPHFYEGVVNLVPITDLLIYDKQYDKAFDMLRNGLEEKDTLLAQRLTQQLSFTNSQYHLNELREENQRMKDRQTRIVIVSLSSVVLLLLILMLVVTYHYVHQRRLNRKLAQSAADLKVAWEKAEESNRLKTAFLQNISHELRTPLNSIVGFSDVLASREREDEEEQMMADLIQRNSSLLLDLVDKLMEISDIEAGTYTLDMKTCNLQGVCDEAIEKVRGEIKPGVELIVTPFLANLCFRADSRRLTEVLVNLLVNAATFTEQGRITVSWLPDGQSKHIVIRVADTGCGVSPADAERIFVRFEKVNTFSQGFGLGLPISRMLIEMMHGRLWLDTDYTDGACFCIELPLESY